MATLLVDLAGQVFNKMERAIEVPFAVWGGAGVVGGWELIYPKTSPVLFQIFSRW